MSNPHKAKIAQLSRQLQSVENRRRFLTDMESLFDKEMSRWFGSVAKGQTLSKNESSRLHKLIEAIGNDRYFSSIPVDPTPVGLQSSTVFVVSHDWAGAFGESLPQDETSIRLPFDSCMFEFVVNGRPVLFWALDITDQINGILFVEFSNLGWVGWDVATIRDDSITQYVWRQIVAICVSLDAEIATTEIVRAPHQLNAKRQKQGKLPLADYRIIDLSRRHRVKPAAPCAEGTRKRLHFRRGHWRHYEGFKTWIKWQLVGNPDLGFIHHQYKA